MKRSLRRVVGITLLIWLGSCSDSPVQSCSNCPPPPPPLQLIVSDPVSAAGLVALTGGTLALENDPGDSVVFVSLPPGAIPAGSRALIRRVGGGVALGVAVSDGGFDPVLVPAHAGDSIEVVITGVGGDTVVVLGFDVRAGTAPIVVRTEPPPRKRDVPFNSVLVVVFSEPVDGSTLNASSVRLFRGASAVAGAVRLLEGSTTAAVFGPAAALSPNTDYRLEVTQAVRDLGSNPLASAETVEFTTGTSVTGSPGSLELSPDSILDLFSGGDYDIAVTIRDAAGNLLTGQPLTWTSSDPAVATVTPADSGGMSRGRVQGVSAGNVTITATSGNLHGTAFVRVIPFSASGVASVTIAPESLHVPAMDGRSVTVTLRDSGGQELGIPGWPIPGGRLEITLTSTDTSVLPSPGTHRAAGCFMSNGRACQGWNRFYFQPRAEGTTVLIATAEGVSDTAVLTVGPAREVASVRLVPAFWTLQPADSLEVLVYLLDADGKDIVWWDGGARPLTWTLDNTAAASADTMRNWTECRDPYHSLVQWVSVRVHRCVLVTARDTGVVRLTVGSGPLSDTVSVSVVRLAFTSVTAGGHSGIWGTYSMDGHTCGTTIGGRTVCWGGDAGAIGDGWGHFSAVPWARPDDLSLHSVSAGLGYTCGLTGLGDAHCWQFNISMDPWNSYWDLGPSDGSWPIPGGHRFVSLAGAQNTCGLTATGAVYCWSEQEPTPVAVPTPHAFTSVSVGDEHACALTADGAAYCWGSNARGQLGDGSTNASTTPVAVGGDLRFVSLTAGDAHTCGLVADGTVHCWGRNASGELGDGTTNDRAVPRIVSGGLTFTALSKGSAAPTTCAVTTAGVAYCWGDNQWGQVGDGSTTNRSAPTPVAGGLPFSSVSTGDRHTCAVSTAAVAYCWGWNGAGQLGTGSQSDSYVPAKVAGQP